MRTENKRRLNERIRNIKISGAVVLVFDFDELVVPIHLTRTITRQLSKLVDEALLKSTGHCSFEGIRYLNHLLEGVKFDEYSKLRDKIAAQTPWRDGFKELIQTLSRKYTLIFLSSGMKDIAYAKLKEISFPTENIIGDEFEIEGNIILGSYLVVSDELKGYVVKKFRQKHNVIAIGHSEGDRLMLRNATVSIGYNSPRDLATYTTATVENILKIIEEQSTP